MTLLLSNTDIERVLDMRACIEALEDAFADLARGEAVNRPRSHTYTSLGAGKHYLFKSMDGGLRRTGLHALRLSSDLTHEHSKDGTPRRDKIPAAPGGRYVGLVLLFDMRSLVPLAIMHDGYLQRMRVGATSALATRHLAPALPRRAGVVGAGWQAGAQLLGLHELGSIDDYRVYAPTRDRLEAFCASYSERLGVSVQPVDTAEQAVRDVDVVALATNAQEPVLDGAWLTAGQHVGSVQGHELDWRTLQRAARVVVRSREEATFHHAQDPPREAANRKHLPPAIAAKVVTLGDVIVGRCGRRDDQEVTLFTGGGTGASSGLGIQFAAVAGVVYEAARASGLGQELPTEWFTQAEKP
jgi:alanine dehydrogenase